METVWSLLTHLLFLHLAKGSVTNVARNKPASMSSNYQSSFNASTAVDGDTTAVYRNGVIHTDVNQDFAWWKVDLERNVQDATVEIYFRTDPKTRRYGVQIYTSTAPFSSYPEGQLCHTVTGDPSGSDIDDAVSVTCTGRWRYLLIYTNTATDTFGPILDFGEVMVLVCDSNFYGSGCRFHCSNRKCLNPASSCDHVTGLCDGGCQPGYTGTDCVQICDSNFYGSGCSSLCSKRKCLSSGSSCDHVTGLCEGGCQPGYTGTDCVQICSLGSYGSRCSQLCSDRHCLSFSAACNSTSGSCDGDCRSGWMGTDCTQVCQTGMYGVSCTKTCSSRHCVTPSSECDHQTGQCIGGCQDRWRGVDCMEECPAGTFGVRCTSCSTRHCQGDSDCPADGRCSQGCQDGWTLTTCTQACPPGSYGSGCNKTCGNCSESSSCNHVTGYCSVGCEHGWMSERCDQAIMQEKSVVIVPVVAGAVAAVLVIVVVVVVVILYKRRKNSQEDKSSPFQDDIPSKKKSGHVDDSNMYVNVAMEKRKDKAKSVNIPKTTDHKENPLPQRSSRDVEDDQSEEILDEDDAPSTSAYYNISESEVIREITVEDLEVTVQKIQHREGGFEAEYSRLPTGFMSTYADSQKEENAGKNKFRGYYPYDHNRVRLSSIPDIPGSDYINASFIHSYDQTKTYIAAQAPNKKTVGDFWRMIWEQRCGRVVMLTGLVEGGKVKCYQYWPEKDKFTTDYFRIEMELPDIRADFTIRTMKVTKLETGECRTVVQYHYTTWPDHGVPDTLSVVNFIWMIRRMDTQTDGPLLVHCSAGIGRTGTYIAVDSLLDQARGEGKVDVLGYVSAMREERKNMIQTKEQYECVFHSLVEMTKYGNTSLDVNNFTNIYSNSGMNGRVDGKTLRELVTKMLSEEKSGVQTKNRLWVDGCQDFLVRSVPSLRNLRGHLLAVSPSPGLEKLLWKLVEENNVHNIIVISQIQKDLAGENGQTRNVGNFKVTTVGQTNLTSDVSHVTLQLQVPNVESKQNIKLMKFQGTVLFELFSSLFLEHAHLKVMSAELESSVIVHSEADRKLAVTFCVMRNILSEILEDQQVDVISQVKKFTKCFPDVDFTQSEVEKLFDFAKKCVQMTASTYANM